MAQRPIATIHRMCFCESATIKVADRGNAVSLWTYCVHASETVTFDKGKKRYAFARVECGQFGEFVYEVDLWGKA